MTGWERWFTGNCARDYNMILLSNDIYTNQNLFEKMRCIKILWDFQIQTVLPILANWIDLVLTGEKTIMESVLSFQRTFKKKNCPWADRDIRGRTEIITTLLISARTAMKVYSAFPIRLFSVISRTIVRGEVFPLCRDAVGVFYNPSRLRRGLRVSVYIYM